MKKFFVLLTLFSGFIFISKAQTPTPTLVDSTVSINKEPFFIPEEVDTNLDRLLKNRNTNYNANFRKNLSKQDTTIINDSEIALRLAKLPTVVPLHYNESVQKYINYYLQRRRDVVGYMLGLTNFYFPMIEKTLDEYQLPLELKYLTIIESALNPTALSRAGASGLWQFMLPTGKSYGLEINSLVDERRSPERATRAACKYLKDMYAVYGDWHLVIAAYNCGEGNVNKAIKRSKGKKNFWEIYSFLPKETRSYVPLFIAATYVMNYYADHHINPVMAELPMSTDTVMVSKLIHFDQISAILNIDKEQIRNLNPQFKQDIIPGNYKTYSLLLPAVYAYGFAELEDTIATYRTDELFTERNYVVKTEQSRTSKITHKVKTGETLYVIANQYGVTAKQIRTWNKLRSNKIAKGRNLILYIDNGGMAIGQSKKTQQTS